MIRIIAFFVFMAVFSATFALGAEFQLSEDEASQLMHEFEAMVEGIDSVGIFVHNTTVSLPMFIPGFGIAWGMFSALMTGIAFSAMEMQNPILSQIPPLTILYVTPFGLMELAAYSIAMSRSYLLIFKIIKRRSIKPDIKITLIEIGILVGLLLVGGFIEFYMIETMPDSILDMSELDPISENQI